MVRMHRIILILLLFQLGLFLVLVSPALSLDQVVKLYICQTEHDLEEITSWEYSAPEKYRQATKNGKLTPLDAAQESAGNLVAMEKIQCDAENKVAIQNYRNENDPGTAFMRRMEGPELEQYCPRTIKKYGHPCR